MFNIISLILFLPFINFLFLSFFGQSVGIKGSSFLSFCHSALLTILSLITFFKFTSDNVSFLLNLGSWINSGLLNIQLEFIFDSLSISMLVLVTVVSTTVHWYSLEYMYSDPFLTKFMSYLSLFTLFMIILVTSTDLGVILIGWEGVGICSFLLISFWNTRLTAYKSAVKAIIFNRFGDLGFFIGLSLIISSVKSLNIHVIFQTLPYFKYSIVLIPFLNVSITFIDLVFFFLCFGVIGKSAQIGLHVWLLDAMEGPTPVSALIHAATMVTAGVFILIRLSFILEFSNSIKVYIAVIGSITALSASLIAVFQTDIKSIVAYSTCSQLGYMVLACGVSSYSVSFFHLFNHGFFKALLFLSSGIIIHNFMEEQDIRKMGSLFFSFPLTYTFFIIASASLMGVPFLSGFFSKDLIIEVLNSIPFVWVNFIYKCALYSVFFSSLYSVKLLYLVFITAPNASFSRYSSSESFTWPMVIGLMLLCLGSIFSGFLFQNFFTASNNTFFFDSVFSIEYAVNTNINFIEFYYLYESNQILFNPKLHTIYLVLVSFIFYYFVNSSNQIYLTGLSNNHFFYMYSFFSNGLHFNFIFIYFLYRNIANLFWFFFILEKAYIENILKVFVIKPVVSFSYLQNSLYKNRTSFEFVYFFLYCLIVLFIVVHLI